MYLDDFDIVLAKSYGLLFEFGYEFSENQKIIRFW